MWCLRVMRLFVIRGGWADTSNGEKCSAPTWKCTRSFQLLSFDSDVQGWMMVWGKPKYLKMNGRRKALDVFQRENTAVWDTDPPHVSTACQEPNAGVHLSVSDRSLRLKAPQIFCYYTWIMNQIISQRHQPCAGLLTYSDEDVTILITNTCWLEN